MLKLREDAIAWREVDGETLVLDLNTSTYLAVNPSATMLWGLLAGGTTRDAMVAALVEAYEVPKETVAQDVDDFLADCTGRGLITDVPEPGRE